MGYAEWVDMQIDKEPSEGPLRIYKEPSGRIITTR